MCAVECGFSIDLVPRGQVCRANSLTEGRYGGEPHQFFYGMGRSFEDHPIDQSRTHIPILIRMCSPGPAA